ncbi:MAG: hypothetical protein HN644_10545 [Rhodospirillales bacterium]|jgi:hypothetical protein|nr:hypothetical protein [Rhodospirillales bacterium]MBT4041010.1 hypothetical protein [Rhodospirillales bacterium]MBT4626020.1 hypothetical protein [Rhodospirillales bacterium]MBT5350303.1 hypothetical protein [Rhodospirillales bacterium]MBT5520296.1 hypothetical protein [Rhodospirillales bacterium]
MPTAATLKSFGQGLMLVGFVCFLGAVVWWHKFYSGLLGGDVKMATECFYQTTQDCAVGNMAVSMISEVPTYRPEFLWAACIVMVAGLLLALSQHEEAKKEAEIKG